MIIGAWKSIGMGHDSLMQHQRKKCWKNKIVAEITLGITPRNPRLHTKGSLHHTKTLVIAGNFFNSFIHFIHQD